MFAYCASPLFSRVASRGALKAAIRSVVVVAVHFRGMRSFFMSNGRITAFVTNVAGECVLDPEDSDVFV